MTNFTGEVGGLSMFEGNLGIELGRALVLFAFLGIGGWTLRCVTRIWIPVVRGTRSAWK